MSHLFPFWANDAFVRILVVFLRAFVMLCCCAARCGCLTPALVPEATTRITYKGNKDRFVGNTEGTFPFSAILLEFRLFERFWLVFLLLALRLAHCGPCCALVFAHVRPKWYEEFNIYLDNLAEPIKFYVRVRTRSIAALLGELH